MDEQTKHVNERASGSGAPDPGRAHSDQYRGGRRLARSLLARRTAWRRRVVASMVAGLAVVAVTHVAFAEYATAAPGTTTITFGGS